MCIRDSVRATYQHTSTRYGITVHPHVGEKLLEISVELLLQQHKQETTRLGPHPYVGKKTPWNCCSCGTVVPLCQKRGVERHHEAAVQRTWYLYENMVQIRIEHLLVLTIFGIAAVRKAAYLSCVASFS